MPVRNWIVFYSFVIDHEIPFAYVRPLCADIVEKVENRTTATISQMLIFGQLRRGIRRSADTKVRGRFWVKRCGPSHRRVRNASAALKNFVRRAEKDFFNTIRQQRSSRQQSVPAHQIEVLLTRRARLPRLLPPKKCSSPARQPTTCKDCQRAASTVPIAPKYPRLRSIRLQ